MLGMEATLKKEKTVCNHAHPHPQQHLERALLVEDMLKKRLYGTD